MRARVSGFPIYTMCTRSSPTEIGSECTMAAARPPCMRVRARRTLVRARRRGAHHERSEMSSPHLVGVALVVAVVGAVARVRLPRHPRLEARRGGVRRGSRSVGTKAVGAAAEKTWSAAAPPPAASTSRRSASGRIHDDPARAPSAMSWICSAISVWTWWRPSAGPRSPRGGAGAWPAPRAPRRGIPAARCTTPPPRPRSRGRAAPPVGARRSPLQTSTRETGAARVDNLSRAADEGAPVQCERGAANEGE